MTTISDSPYELCLLLIGVGPKCKSSLGRENICPVLTTSGTAGIPLILCLVSAFESVVMVEVFYIVPLPSGSCHSTYPRQRPEFNFPLVFPLACVLLPSIRPPCSYTSVHPPFPSVLSLLSSFEFPPEGGVPGARQVGGSNAPPKSHESYPLCSSACFDNKCKTSSRYNHRRQSTRERTETFSDNRHGNCKG